MKSNRLSAMIVTMFTICFVLPFTATAALNWTFNGSLPAGWTVVNGSPEFVGVGVEAEQPNGNRAHDAAHTTLILESPEFVFTGGDTLAGGTSVRVITEGGAGNQNGLPDPINEAAVLAVDSGTSIGTGIKGVAFLRVTSGNYERVLYDPGNGGGVQTVAENAATTGLTTGEKYRLQIIEYDDGGWGWTRFNEIEVDAVFCDDQADADNDGVNDCDDKCEGFDDSVDTDNDGIPDGCDECPDPNNDTEAPTLSFTSPLILECSDDASPGALPAMTVTDGLLAWYDAAVGVTTDGNGVSSWADKSGNGHTATRQSGTINVDAAAVNGLPAVQVRAAGNAYLNVAGNMNMKQQFAVFRSANASWNNYGALLGRRSGRDSNNLFDNNQTRFHGNQLPAAVSKNGTALSGPFDLAPITEYMMVAITVNDNGLIEESYYLGRSDHSVSDIDIAEVIGFDRVLSAAEEAKVGDYFTTKYGLSTTYKDLTVSASDNCDPNPTVAHVEDLPSVGDSCSSQFIRRWRATDASGNVTIGDQTVIIQDTTPPVFVGALDDIVVTLDDNCDGVLPAAPAVNATDACQPTGNITFSGPVETSTGSGCNRVVVRTWTADDGCGNQATATQTVTFEDVIPPEITYLPPDITVECGSDLAPGSAALGGSATGADECSPVITTANTTAGLAVRAFYGRATGNAEKDLPSILNGVTPDYAGSLPAGVPLDFNDDNDFRTKLGNPGQPNDHYIYLFEGLLVVTAGEAGNWNFNLAGTDDVTALFVDRNQNGSFDNGAALDAGERVQNENGNTTINLAAGTYKFMVLHKEHGGGSHFEARFTRPGSGQVLVDPSVSGQPFFVSAVSSSDSLSSSTDPAGCIEFDLISRTWTVSDGCGNTASAIQTITIIDTQAPSFDQGSFPANAVVDCEADGAAEFTPALLSGLEVWYSADVGVTVNGGVVTGWADQSGNGRDLVAWTGTPTLEANEINGLPAVRFNANNENLQMADPGNTYFAKDVYLVFRSGNGTKFGPSWGAPFGVKDGNDANRMWMMQGNEDRFWGNETPDAVSRNGLVIPSANNFDMSGPTGNASMGEYMVMKIEAKEGTGTATSNQNLGNGSHPREYIVGTRTDAWSDSRWDTAELLAFDHALSPEEENLLGGYLAEKYDIATSYEAASGLVGTDPLFTGALPTANDSCTDPVVTYSDSAVAGSNAGEWIITRTFTATDNCGNETVAGQTQTITITDTSPPEITSVPADITLECDKSIVPGEGDFELTVLDGLTLWFDASDVDGQFDGSNGDPAVGAGVSTWVDKSGNGFEANDVLGDPKLAAGPNGTTVVEFDGNDAIRTEDSANPRLLLAGQNGYTLISVARYTGNDNGGRERVIAAKSGHNWLFGFHDHTVNRWHYDGWLSLDVGGRIQNDNNWQLHVGTMKDLNSGNPLGSTWRNGGALTVNGNGSGNSFNNNVPDGLSFGAWQTATRESSECEVAEVIMYDRELTAAELDEVGGYLASKHGLDTSYPAARAGVGEATVFDVCDPSPTVLFEDDVDPQDCENNVLNVITRSFRAVDACGNQSAVFPQTQRITIVDTTAPELSVPADLTLDCQDSTSPVDTGSATATDACDPNAAVTFSDVVDTNIRGPRGFLVEAYATDNGGGANDADINNTTEAKTIWDAIDGGASVPGLVSIGSKNYNIGRFETDKETRVIYNGNFDGYGGSLAYASINDDGPGGGGGSITGGDDFSVRATAYLEFSVGGTYSISTGSDDGRCIELTAVAAPGYAGFSSAGGQLTGFSAGDTKVVFNGTTGHNHSTGVFSVNAGDVLKVVTFFFERGGGDQFHLSIKDAADTGHGGTGDGFALLEDGVFGIDVLCSFESGAAGQCYQITRTWTAEDDCGNQSSAVQLIKVEDRSAPVIECPQPATVECTESTDPANTGNPEVEDNCDSAPAITFSDAVASGTCPQNAVITRTWTATDACGNAAGCNQTITVLDRVGPVLSGVPGDVTIECTDDLPPVAVVTANDACDTGLPSNDGLVSFWNFDSKSGSTITDVVGSHDGILEGNADITIGGQGFGGGEALELSGNGDYMDVTNPTTFDFNSSFTWHARIKTADNSGAVFSRNPDGTAWNQGSKAFFVRNRGGNGELEWDTGWVSNPRTFTRVNDDTWHSVIAVYDDSTGFLKMYVDGSLDYNASHNVDLRDEHTFVHNGGIADTSFTVGAADFSGGLASLDTLVGLMDDVAVFDKALSDAEVADLVANGFTSALSFAYEEDVDPGECPQEYVLTREWTFTDACGNSTKGSQDITVQDTTPPPFTRQCEDRTIECDDSTEPNDVGGVPVVGPDACEDSGAGIFTDWSKQMKMTLGYTGQSTLNDFPLLVVLNEGICGFDYDDFASANGDDLRFSTEDKDVELSYEIEKWDTSGNSYVWVKVPAVSVGTCVNAFWGNGAASAPGTGADVWSSGFAGVWHLGEADTGAQTFADSASNNDATDNAGSDTVTGPGQIGDGQTFDGGSDELLVANESAFDFTTEMTVSAWFKVNAFDTTWQALVAKGEGGEFRLHRRGNEQNLAFNAGPGGDTASIGGSVNDGAWHHVLATKSTTDGKRVYIDGSLAVSDGDTGNIGQNNEQVRIGENPDAQNREWEGDVDEVRLSGVVRSADWAKASFDNQGSGHAVFNGYGCAEEVVLIVPELTYQDTVSAGTCVDNSVISRVWRIADLCGNENTCEQIITILDTTAPVITCPADVTVECDETTEPCGSVSDCGGQVPTDPGGIGGGGPFTPKAGSSKHGGGCTGEATATDNCDDDVTITYCDVVAAGSCPQEEVITRTWTAEDNCGNTASCEQTITVVDTTAPTFDQMPPSEEVDCSGAQCPDTGSGASGCSQNDSISAGSGSARIACPAPLQTNVPPVPEVTAQDNCDTDVHVGLVEIQLGECPACIVRTWTATDDCGNATEMIQLIVLRKACVQNWQYWKGRPEEWLTPFGPVTEFEIGCAGDITSAADALLILNGCVGKKSDESVKLAQELIAAILNVAQGADDTCASDAIQEARDYLCVVEVGSNPKGRLKKTAKGLRAALSDYNSGKCCAPKCPEVSGSGANFDCPSGSGGHIDYVPEEVEPHPNPPAGGDTGGDGSFTP